MKVEGLMLTGLRLARLTSVSGFEQVGGRSSARPAERSSRQPRAGGITSETSMAATIRFASLNEIDTLVEITIDREANAD